MILHEKTFRDLKANKRLELESTAGGGGFRLRASYTTENGTSSVLFLLTEVDLFLIAVKLSEAIEATNRGERIE